VAGAVRQEFLGRLENLRLRALSGDGTAPRDDRAIAAPEAIVLAAGVENGRLVLPWESRTSSADVRRVLAEPPFAALISAGEKAELVDQRPADAVSYYRRALAAARLPLQAAAAELLVARALGKAGQTAAALEPVRRAMARPLSLADEHGVPYALYAARRAADLERLEADDARLALDVAQQAGTTTGLAPAAVHMAAAVAEALRVKGPPGIQTLAPGALRTINAQISRVEQSLGLQQTFPALAQQFSSMSGASASEPLWLTFGQEPWLIGLGADLGGRRATLVAIDAAKAFEGLESAASCAAAGGCRLAVASSGGPDGYPLGPALPGLTLLDVTGGATDEPRWFPRLGFYAASLALVLGLAAFGAYLLWRDVRRELLVAELRSQFVSSVSHELKTPLTAIRMFAETLRMGRPADPARRDEYLDTIVNESERLTRLLNNVLEFSRIESGRKTYQFTCIDLESIVRTAARAMEYPAARQGFELTVAVGEGIPPVRGDADALEQAILNLLANALKYSGDSRKIELTLGREGSGAVIGVRDWGIGIEPAEQRRIFEKFYRVERPEHRLIPGTGLGLTLVDHIVRSHHGTVSVHSGPGQGSTFRIHLPLEDEGRAAASADAVAATHLT
jgi:signal transduction histidine kinase